MKTSLGLQDSTDPVGNEPKINPRSLREQMTDWIKTEYLPVIGLTQEVVHLWDNNFRVKIWGENKDKDLVIKTSIFLTVHEVNGSFEGVCQNYDEVKWFLIENKDLVNSAIK